MSVNYYMYIVVQTSENKLYRNLYQFVDGNKYGWFINPSVLSTIIWSVVLHCVFIGCLMVLGVTTQML